MTYLQSNNYTIEQSTNPMYVKKGEYLTDITKTWNNKGVLFLLSLS